MARKTQQANGTPPMPAANTPAAEEAEMISASELKEAAADGVEKTPIEAVADGSEHELTVEPSEATKEEAEMISASMSDVITALATPTAEAAAAMHDLGLATRPFAIRVRAVRSFGDVLTRRDYNPGDVVPWDLERAARYAAQGFVVIEDGDAVS